MLRCMILSSLNLYFEFQSSPLFLVVTSKELRRNGDIWVCSIADHVVTRFFFVYDEMGQSRAHTIHTQKKDFKQEITHAINLAQQLKRK